MDINLKIHINAINGSGRIDIKNIVEFEIPPLVKENSQFIKNLNGVSYIIRVKFKKSSTDRFDRKGNDLYITIPIDPVYALIGGNVIVPGFKKSIKLTFPENVKGSATYRIANEGVPGTDGSMFINLVIDYNLANINQINKIRKLFRNT